MASPLNEYFDKIFCINLDRRTDRWERSQAEFLKHGLDVERVAAVDGSTLKLPAGGKIRPPEFGCILSHKAVLKAIVDNGWERVLILEDDVEFADDLNSRFANAIRSVPYWDMLYLGGNHVTKPTRINEFFSKNIRTFTTSHYAVTNKAAAELLPLVNAVSQIDVTYSRMRSILAYSFTPPLAWQLSGYSDIQGGHTDYEFMKTT